MGAISNYLEVALLNAVFRGIAFTSPTNVFAALYTSYPTDADIGIEVNAPEYTRQLVTFTIPTQDALGRARISNSTEIAFPAAQSNWGTITHIGLRDDSTTGNLLYYGPLANPKVVNVNDQLKIVPGDLVITLD